MAAATGVKRADQGKGPREQRIIPLAPMGGDVELLRGLATLDAKEAQTIFRFTRGSPVRVGDRNGTVVEGYASGRIKQHEIESESGERFMATEQSVTAR